MIALFDEPPRVSIRTEAPVDGRNGLLLGFAYDNRLHGLVCLENGELTFLDASEFTIDYRYDAEGDTWVDLNDRNPPGEA